jgi:hypothetical protein
MTACDTLPTVGRWIPQPADRAPRVPSSAIVNRTGLDTQRPVPSARPLLGGPFTRWPRAADAVLALVVFLVTVLVSPGPFLA